jgi:hypothetical protein
VPEPPQATRATARATAGNAASVGQLGLPGPVRRHRRRRPRSLLRRRRRRSRSSGAARPANVGRYRVLPLWITGGTIHSRLLIGGAMGGAMGHLQVLQFQISGFTILISSINSKQFQIKTSNDSTDDSPHRYVVSFAAFLFW